MSLLELKELKAKVEDKEIRIKVVLSLTDYTPREILDKLSKETFIRITPINENNI